MDRKGNNRYYEEVLAMDALHTVMREIVIGNGIVLDITRNEKKKTYTVVFRNDYRKPEKSAIIVHINRLW